MKRVWFSAVLLGLTLTSCSVLQDDNGPLDEMLAAKRRWERLNIDYYSFEFQMSCECQSVRKVRIYVEADTIHSATYVDDGSPVQPGSGSRVQTIDGLFEWLIDELRRDPDESRAWFHQEYHFPRELYIDSRKNVIDDEFWLYVTNFVKHERLD